MSPETLKKRLSLTQVPPAHKKFADVIGLDAMIDLCYMYSTERIYVPNLTKIQRIQRNREICKCFCDGMHNKDLAKKFNLSVRAIYNIVYSNSLRSKENSDESDMFAGIPTTSLSENVAQLFENLGEENTLRLCGAFGGTDLEIPSYRVLEKVCQKSIKPKSGKRLAAMPTEVGCAAKNEQAPYEENLQ